MARAAAVSAACLRSPNTSAVSAASFAPAASSSTSTSGSDSNPMLPSLARLARVRALTLRFHPPPSGISPTRRPTRALSRLSGTTSAFVDGSANTRCFTSSASALVC